MKAHEDHRYLIALREGDNILLQELYSKYSPQIISWIKKNNGSMSDAKDVFQEALIALYNKSCDPDFILSFPIGGLLFQICRNKWIDQIRKKKKESEVRIIEVERYNSEQHNTSIIEQIEEEEIRQKVLNDSFNKLSELCQKLLREVSKGTSSKNIAIQLTMNDVNTVYRRKNACIERWKSLYQSLAT